jgi:hypothetical protein
MMEMIDMFIRSGKSWKQYLETRHHSLADTTKLKVLGLLSLACMSLSAQAAVLPVVPHQEALMPVNSTAGTVLQFSLPVKAVTAAKMFSIKDFSSGVSATGQKADVRSFVVQAATATANESVTFVLANNKPIVLRLTSSAAADKFVDVQLHTHTKSGKGGFLSKELALMRSMLLDEAGSYSREVVSKHFESALPRTKVQLVRMYRSGTLTGYVINIENHGKEELVLDPSRLALGVRVAPVLSHLSKSKISPCPVMNSEASCTATARFVVRGSTQPPSALQVRPFVRRNAVNGGGDQ